VLHYCLATVLTLFVDFELVRLYHPDKVDPSSTPSEVAHARFQAIASAYKFLQERTQPGYQPTPEEQAATMTAANARARQIYRQRRLYSGGDERWKDWIVFGGVIAVSYLPNYPCCSRYSSIHPR
jgi:hypothetical protein